MDLYFANLTDNDGDNAANWFEDNGSFAVPHLSTPTAGDNAYFSSGTCSGFTFSCDYVAVAFAVTITNNTGTITDNQGTITNNTGTIVNNTSGGVVTTNASGGTITNNNNGATVTTNASGGSVLKNEGVVVTNNGNVRISLGGITGGSGTISASSTTDLSNHTAGTNVTLPSASLIWW